MSRTNKIILSVVGGLILIVAFSCLYGFTIGGNDICSVIFLITSSLLITVLIFIFIFGKDFATNNIVKKVAIGVAFCVFAISFFTYNGLNKISADESKTVEYEAEITYFSSGYRGPDTIYFLNSQGFEVDVTYLDAFISFEEGIYPDEAEFVLIREIQGGFGYTIYEVLGFK